jgi:AcrR family transcriptional regulator
VSTGLRERKKARTRAAIQQHALRLFRLQGYEQTTVEQIAEAAEVSPSTFFRYFPSKEEVVLYDAFDPVLFEAFRAQPANLPPLQAVRAAFRSAFDALPAEEVARNRERADLTFRVPDLRMRMLDQMVGSIRGFAAVVAERYGKKADDPSVLALVGAVMGVGITMMLPALEGWSEDPFALMDKGLALLEAGLPL